MKRAPIARVRPKKKPPGFGRRVALAAGLLVALCGVVLVAFGGGVEPVRPAAAASPPPRAHLTRRALQRAEEAENALRDQDYGRARERVREVRRLLAEAEGGSE